MEGLRALYAYPGLNQRNEGNRESVENHCTLCFAGVWPWHSAISQSLADVLLPPTSLLFCVLLIMLSSLGSRLHVTNLLLYHCGELTLPRSPGCTAVFLSYPVFSSLLPCISLYGVL